MMVKIFIQQELSIARRLEGPISADPGAAADQLGSKFRPKQNKAAAELSEEVIWLI